MECPGCSAPVLLRLGVGHDARQPFFYVCPRCKAATRAALLWDGGAGTTLELSAGRLLDGDADFVGAVSINPEIPPSSSGSAASRSKNINLRWLNSISGSTRSGLLWSG